VCGSIPFCTSRVAVTTPSPIARLTTTGCCVGWWRRLDARSRIYRKRILATFRLLHMSSALHDLLFILALLLLTGKSVIIPHSEVPHTSLCALNQCQFGIQSAATAFAFTRRCISDQHSSMLNEGFSRRCDGSEIVDPMRRYCVLFLPRTSGGVFLFAFMSRAITPLAYGGNLMLTSEHPRTNHVGE
jgi:hypothetical protein